MKKYSEKLPICGMLLALLVEVFYPTHLVLLQKVALKSASMKTVGKT